MVLLVINFISKINSIDENSFIFFNHSVYYILKKHIVYIRRYVTLKGYKCIKLIISRRNNNNRVCMVSYCYRRSKTSSFRVKNKIYNIHHTLKNKNKQKIITNYVIRFLRQYLIVYNIFKNVISKL